MFKKLALTAAAFSLAAMPAFAGERASLQNHEVRPAAQVSVDHQLQAFDDLERAGAEEAWYPGCLATSIIDGINGVTGCFDSWSPTCLAVSVSGMISNVQGCGN